MRSLNTQTNGKNFTKEEEKKFQQRPIWISLTILIFLIQASPAISDLLLDFFPLFSDNEKWIKLSFIILGSVLLFMEYLKDKEKHHDSNKMSITEQANYYEKKAKWFILRQNIFKYYPLNIIKLRIIPLSICWVISQFINKEYKSYSFSAFDFPKYWEKNSETPEDKEKYNYKKVISKFFKSMFRVYIKNLNQSYEVKFERDFQNIEIRWTDKYKHGFSNPKNDLYNKTFSEDEFKHVKIFTWIFPFGLYWNLRRIIKSLF